MIDYIWFAECDSGCLLRAPLKKEIPKKCEHGVRLLPWRIAAVNLAPPGVIQRWDFSFADGDGGLERDCAGKYVLFDDHERAVKAERATIAAAVRVAFQGTMPKNPAEWNELQARVLRAIEEQTP